MPKVKVCFKLMTVDKDNNDDSVFYNDAYILCDLRIQKVLKSAN